MREICLILKGSIDEKTKSHSIPIFIETLRISNELYQNDPMRATELAKKYNQPILNEIAP